MKADRVRWIPHESQQTWKHFIVLRRQHSLGEAGGADPQPSARLSPHFLYQLEGPAVRTTPSPPANLQAGCRVPPEPRVLALEAKAGGGWCRLVSHHLLPCPGVRAQLAPGNPREREVGVVGEKRRWESQPLSAPALNGNSSQLTRSCVALSSIIG